MVNWLKCAVVLMELREEENVNYLKETLSTIEEESRGAKR